LHSRDGLAGLLVPVPGTLHLGRGVVEFGAFRRVDNGRRSLIPHAEP